MAHRQCPLPSVAANLIAPGSMAVSRNSLAHSNKNAGDHHPITDKCGRRRHARKSRVSVIESGPEHCDVRLRFVWEATISSEKKLVAVVDDDPEVRSALARVLLEFGYEVETFDSAMTFFNCASTCRANCLVVDVEMSENSGIDLAHALAADGYEFPIIFMSGRTDVTV